MDDRSTIADLQARLLEAEARLRGQAEVEADLRSNLDALWRVCRLHARVANEPDLKTRMEEIVEAANGILGTDRGCIQLVSPDGTRLEMFAYRGYGPDSPFIRQFLRAGSKVACDTVRQKGMRLIIDDVANFPALQGTEDREVGLLEGILATQSTPMVTRGGEQVGVLSNQFRMPHRPTDAQLRLIDLLAWNAAEIVERHQTEAALQASERRLQRVLETDSVAVLFFNQQGVLLDANDAFLTMTGHSREDVVAGRLSWQRMTPPEWLAASQAQMDRFWVEGRIGPYEKEYFRKDGARAWMLFSGRDLGDGTIVELGIDITARKRAEAVLLESEARLAAAFESVPVGAAVIDMNGVAVISNAEFRRFLPAGLIPSRDPARGSRWRAWDAEGRLLSPIDYPGARALRGERVVPGQEMLFTDEQGREIWTTVATSPIRNEWQEVTGTATAISDVNAAKLSAEALRQSDDRFRQFGDASQDILWIRDARTYQWEYLTPAFETICGLDRDAALRGDHRAAWLDLIVPEDRELADASLRLVHEGESVTFEYRIRRPVDGQLRWLRSTVFPIRDAAGNVIRIGGIGHNVTELKSTGEALAAAELRQRTLMEGIPQLVWRSGVNGGWTWASPQWLEFTGQTQAQSHGQGWLVAVHPDDQAATIQAWELAEAEGALDVEHRIRRGIDHAWIWHHTRSTPVRAADGRILEWLGTSTDIQNLRALQDQQQVLVAELQHRTRNLLGVVRSMSEKTARASVDLSDFRARFRDRLEALSRVQGHLARVSERGRVTFDELLESELAAMQGAADRVSLDGPRGVQLRSSTVQTIALALHELATNAVKYGALGQPTAKLVVRWSVQPGDGDRPSLHVDWRERGVTMPAAGTPGGGQGRELIERALPYQLGAKTSFALQEDGVHCTLSIPVSTNPAPAWPTHD